MAATRVVATVARMGASSTWWSGSRHHVPDRLFQLAQYGGESPCACPTASTSQWPSPGPVLGVGVGFWLIRKDTLTGQFPDIARLTTCLPRVRPLLASNDRNV